MKSEFIETLLEHTFKKLDESDIDGLSETLKRVVKDILNLDDSKLSSVTGLTKHSDIKEFVNSWIEFLVEKESKSKDWLSSFKEFTGKSKINSNEARKYI
tara:strand:- start:207 stop:506 length:300 start_codon:yes stop_codon:yes gene_type:complete